MCKVALEEMTKHAFKLEQERDELFEKYVEALQEIARLERFCGRLAAAGHS